jgi:hypothetical protein
LNHHQDGSRGEVEFATPRKTVIIEQEGEVGTRMIQREDMVVTIGLRQARAASTYRAQRRGGKDRSRPATGLSAVCSWPRPTRRCCSSRRRSGLQRKGLALPVAGRTVTARR